MVGYPLTPTSWHKDSPSAVQSTSATTKVLESLNCCISLSHAGFIDLQCPHHGARNLTKTLLPAVSVSQVSFVNSRAPAPPKRNTNTSLDAIAKNAWAQTVHFRQGGLA